MAAPRGRLVVVANRAPVEIAHDGSRLEVRRTVGGLATALDDALRAHPGLWIAWAGRVAEPHLEPPVTGLPYPIRSVALTECEIENYYAGFANQMLWPLCHLFTTYCRSRPAFWAAYRDANQRFADQVRDTVAPGDIVWVNDFHLCLVPGLLRAAAVPARVGIFWHIPFPPAGVFGICRQREALLCGLLGADVVGFQTGADVEAFLGCVRDFLDLPVADDPPRVVLPRRTVRAVALPVGIDAARFRAQASATEVQEHAERLRATLGTELVLLGVDRLDYTKGIVERLLGFECFLERNPAWRNRTCFVQITVPSRFHVPQYRAMKRQIDETVGRIVGRFACEGRSPLAYHYTALDHEQLAAYYLAADVALVTPLRDGMNLVAKEYVACHAERTGVLVLSEFAGAARELTQALRVNPHEPEAIARAIEAAVGLSAREKAQRMDALVERVSTRDIRWWTSAFLDLIRAPHDAAERPAPPGIA